MAWPVWKLRAALCASVRADTRRVEFGGVARPPRRASPMATLNKAILACLSEKGADAAAKMRFSPGLDSNGLSSPMSAADPGTA
jgi:hypothetical protein